MSDDKLNGNYSWQSNNLFKMIRFIWIVLGLFAWISSFILLTSPIVIAHDMEKENQDSLKVLLEQMTADNLPPGIIPEELPEPNSSGAKLLQKYCSQCHDIFSPRMHSAEKWSSVLQRVSWHMQICPIGEKMSRMELIKAPSPQEGTELLNYLKRHSLHAADQGKLEHLDSPSGIRFLQTCAQCHALPDPKQHSIQEWPGVTKRMKHNMQFMNKKLIQPKEEALLLQFLQQSASQ